MHSEQVSYTHTQEYNVIKGYTVGHIFLRAISTNFVNGLEKKVQGNYFQECKLVSSHHPQSVSQ